MTLKQLESIIDKTDLTDREKEQIYLLVLDLIVSKGVEVEIEFTRKAIGIISSCKPSLLKVMRNELSIEDFQIGISKLIEDIDVE